MSMQWCFSLFVLVVARGASGNAAADGLRDEVCQTQGAMLIQKPLSGSETKRAIVADSELQIDDAGRHVEKDSANRQAGLYEVDAGGKWIYVGSCWTSQYGALMFIVLIIMLAIVVDDIRNSRRANHAEAKVRGLQAKLAADKAIIKADEKDLKSLITQLRNDEKRLYEDIVGRGLVNLDVTGRSFTLKKNIDFVTPSHDEPPTAQFANEFEARLTLVDVAQLLRIFDTAVVLVEGHTASPLSNPLEGIDEWAHQLAYNRAEMVKLELVAFGVDEMRLEALGLPGRIGMDSHGVQLNIIRVSL